MNKRLASENGSGISQGFRHYFDATLYGILALLTYFARLLHIMSVP